MQVGPASGAGDRSRLRKRRFAPISVIVLLVVSSGCATYASRVIQTRNAFYMGDLTTAEAPAKPSFWSRRGEDDVYELERAMALLAGGKPKEAEQSLRLVRDRFEKLEGQTALDVVASYTSDDTKRPYAGEDYEKVLIRVMLALANLMHDGGDAEAYSLQIVEKQQQIIEAAKKENEGRKEKGRENPRANYKQIALGAYLRGILREETQTNYDDATRALLQVKEWAPEFESGREDLARVQSGQHSAKGNGVLYVFGLVGHGPIKIQTSETPSSTAMFFADQIVSAVGSQTVTPTVAPILVPRVVATPRFVAALGVDVDGQPMAQTETITDVTRLAIEQYDAIFPQVVARAVARRALKKGLLFGAKEFTGVQKGSLTGLAVDVAGIAWEAMEVADTRCWGLLPDQIQVVRIELPAGDHRVDLRALNPRNQPMGAPSCLDVKIEDGRNTYMMAMFPENRLVGEILSSRGADQAQVADKQVSHND